MMKIKPENKNNPSVCKLGTVPFLIGAYSTPHNPYNLPNVLPFSYFINQKTGVLSQSYNEKVDTHLQTAYKNGTHPGAPMDTEGEGAGYLFDFFSFIEKTVNDLNGKEILEIGCGKGFLLKLLQEKKSNVIGIEPGKMHERLWEENNVTVVNDFFPSKKINRKFDLIISYAVLEHIYDAEKFITAISDQLNDAGQIILAVPNCEQQMENCDPSLFVHEHYSYFSKESLTHFLEIMGFKINLVAYAGYGGSIYICAQKSTERQAIQSHHDSFDIENFANKVVDFTAYLSEESLDLNNKNKSLGIYCPGRAITSIDLHATYRFFDDDKKIQGQYFPPFPFSIESRQDLIDNPVDVLWVFSYSFGDKIKEELIKNSALSQTKIITLRELRSNTKVSDIK